MKIFYFKPNFIKLINQNLFENYLLNGTKRIVSEIIKGNKITEKYLSKYKDTLSYISYSLINNIFLHYYSSSLSDYLFNLIKISSNNNNLPLNSIKAFSLSKTLYLISKFIEPFLLEQLKTKYLGIFITRGIKISNIVLKLLYMTKDNFIYFDLFDYLFGIITLKNNNENNDINISFVLCFIIIAYKCFQKINQKEIKNQKFKKNEIKIINEIKRNEVIPIPTKFTKLSNNNIKSKGFCLICKKAFKSPTAIICCGGVFCFNCIYNYLLVQKRCFLCHQDFLNENIYKNKILIKLYP